MFDAHWYFFIGATIGGLLSWLAFQSQINELEHKLEELARK